MARRDERETRKRDVQQRKSGKENRKQVAPIVHYPRLMGGYFDAPIIKGKGGREESSRVGLAVPKKTKGMVVITSVRMGSE
jgi:hypothetical protein